MSHVYTSALWGRYGDIMGQNHNILFLKNQ
jgi:hypothetical protein